MNSLRRYNLQVRCCFNDDGHSNRNTPTALFFFFCLCRVTEQLPPFYREIQSEEMWLYKFHRVETDHVPTALMFVRNVSAHFCAEMEPKKSVTFHFSLSPHCDNNQCGAGVRGHGLQLDAGESKLTSPLALHLKDQAIVSLTSQAPASTGL